MATKTRKAIEDSFLRLAERKPVDKITVKEIVEDCNLNRNSFYYHFEDLPDLIEKTLEEQLFAILDQDQPQTVNEMYHSILKGITDNQAVLRNIYFSKNREILEVKLLHLSDSSVRKFMESRVFHGVNMSREDKEAIIRSYKWDVIGMIVDWVNNGLKFDLEKEFERIYQLRQGTLNTMVSRAEANAKNRN